MINVDLNLVKLEFQIKVKNVSENSAQLFQALQKFDIVFRHACCSTFLNSCTECSSRLLCPFHDVFAQSLSPDPQIVRRHQKPPLPYVFKTSHLTDSLSRFELGLVVFGRAVNHLDVFIKTVNMLIESSGTHCLGWDSALIGVFCCDYQSVNHKLDLSSLDFVLLSARELMEDTGNPETVELIFESPLRLIKNGSLLYAFDFSVFMRSQMRRCSSLYAYYGDGELDLDYAGLSEASARVKCLEDGISFMKSIKIQGFKQPGLLGAATFGSVSHLMLSLIKLGTYFNAGKGASVGYGEYRVNW